MNDHSKGLVRYTSRDYESIMQDFWELVPKLTELWKPEASADPGVVLGKYLANVADMLGVNLDWLANEIFAPSVSQRKNAEKIFSLIGYDLGWYTAARTEITFTNPSKEDVIKLDFGFNGGNFATVSTNTDITGQSRVITYNILPNTNKYGAKDTRSKRKIASDLVRVFDESDLVVLQPGESVTRVGIEGELRWIAVSVKELKQNNLIVTLPSQHIDTTAIWVRARNNTGYLTTQWIQCSNPAEFVTPEPRFAVTYDSYSNAQIKVSNYLNSLQNYEDNDLVIYWIDCSGVIGCVNENVLGGFTPAIISNSDVNSVSDESGDLAISNLSNTVEIPHTHAVAGRSPETAKEAYYNSRNYINTFDSLVTLPDFNRFLNREPGVDCGLVIDCQKAMEINLAIYRDKNITDTQKQKMYITHYDFPQGSADVDWKSALDLGFDPNDPNKFVFSSNFKQYTAMCFAIHNDFQASGYGQPTYTPVTIRKRQQFETYLPPISFIEGIKKDYLPLQTMTVELQFGAVRVFNWHVVGKLYLKQTVDNSNAINIIKRVKEALAIYFSPANRHIGQKPTLMEVVNVVLKADSRIAYFDAGTLNNPVITWDNCDIEYFNPISFARYVDIDTDLSDEIVSNNIQIAPEYLHS